MPLLLVFLFLPPADALAGVNRWTTSGPQLGAINVLASNPDNPSLVYAGTDFDGIFRSVDGGANWTLSSNGLAAAGILALQIDPSSPSVLYAGTQNAGAFRSVDGGDNWEPRSFGLSEFASYVSGFAIDPETPSTIVASTWAGVYRSTNGGCSWALSSTGLPIQNGAFYTQTIVRDPSDPSVLYLGSEFNGAYKSVDRGQSWATSNGFFFRSSVNSFAFDPANASTLYAAASYGDPKAGTSGGGVFKTVDSGGIWTQLGGGSLPNIPFNSVRIDPSDASTIYASSAGAGVFRSGDAGTTWAPINQDLADLGVGPLLVASGSPFFFAGTFGSGVFRSADGGAHWSPSNEGLEAYSGFALVAEPLSPGTVYVGGRPYGGAVSKTLDGGESWTAAATGLPPVTVYSLAIDAIAPSVLYAGLGSFSGVFKSVDGGTTWSPTGTMVESDVNALTVDPFVPSTVYAAGDHGFWRSSDGGVSWDLVAPTNGLARALIADPQTPGTLLDATGGVVQKSTDGGATWSPSNTGLESTYVMSLAQSSSDPLRLLAGTVETGIYRSTDRGSSWAPTSGPLANLAVRSLVFDPADSSIAYAGVAGNVSYPRGGLFRSTDGGQSWSAYDRGLQRKGLPSLAVFALATDSSGTRLFAATFAGVFALETSATPSPLIADVAPASGSDSGPTAITLAGTDFQLGATVLVDGTPAQDVQFIDEEHITATLPSGTPGTTPSLTVVNSDTQFDVRLRGFLYDFSDVPAGALYHDDVRTLALAGVTAGCDEGRFCPSTPITRAQTAILMEKTLHGLDFEYPAAGGVFIDVDRCSPAAKYIYEFLNDGLTNGCGPALFCPANPVTRAQVAVFLLLAKHGPSYVPPPATGSVFADVHQGDFAADFIEELSAEGITAGCGGANYCPTASVTRGQSAAFLVRTFGLP